VFAGAVVAAGTWLVLQLLFTGGALSAIDPDDLDSARVFGIGTTAGTMLAALIAMFVGGLVAGRLAAHYDRKVAGLHGLLVWALTAVAGTVLLASAVGSLVRTHEQAAVAPPAPGARTVVDDAVMRINETLEAQKRPTISVDQVVDASEHAALVGGEFDRGAFIARLDDQSQLDRVEIEAAYKRLGANADDVMAAGYDLAQHRKRAMEAADDAGKGMLAAGVSLVLCLAAAIGGSLLAHRFLTRPIRPRHRTTTSPGHVTAPYPPVTASQSHQTVTPAAPYPPGVTYPPNPRDGDDV
jgi:hypothetical protein